MVTAYLPRVVDAQIERLLGVAGAVLLEGARACGKTATGQSRAASSVRFDVDNDAIALAEVDPGLLLDGATPRLIDEWQLVPAIWNRVRRAIDDRGEPGQFILTGSALPADDVTRHSGAGRIVRVRMRTMSLLESGHSTGDASLTAVFEGGAVSGRSALTLPEVVDRICIGGWPALRGAPPRDAVEVLRSYLDDVARVDVPSLDGGSRRDPIRLRRTIASLARHTATEASHRTIASDTSVEGQAIQAATVGEYHNALERVMVVEDQPSWGTHLRSKDLIRQAPKRHFVDPSLAAAALNATPSRLLRDPNTLGLLFESLVVRDLRVYAQSIGGTVRHYRDSRGTEVDAIIDLPDGRWVAAEVKLGAAQADAAAESLARFVDKLDPARVDPPTARMVITAGEFAYTRPGGVHVVPLGALAP